MKLHFLFLAMALAITGGLAENAFGGSERLNERTIQGVVNELNNWIAANTDLAPRPFPAAKIKPVEPGQLVIAHGGQHRVRERNRGLYDTKRGIIYLRQPWDPRDVHDQSVLLHELVHHAQVHARHWYCPQAMEWDAYKLQEKWLAAHGIDADFNWTAILLESSCAKRDYHPD